MCDDLIDFITTSALNGRSVMPGASVQSFAFSLLLSKKDPVAPQEFHSRRDAQRKGTL